MCTYTITAVDAAGNESSPSAPSVPTTISDTMAPSTPTGLATVASHSEITLTRNAPTDNIGVTRYRVLRNGLEVGTPKGSPFYDTGLSIATAYSYTVSARDAAGNESDLSTTVNATTEASPNTAVLEWGFVPAPGVSGYRVHYGTAAGVYFQPLGAGVNVGNVTTYKVADLTSGTGYYFAVTADGSFGIQSGYTNELFLERLSKLLLRSTLQGPSPRD